MLQRGIKISCNLSRGDNVYYVVFDFLFSFVVFNLSKSEVQRVQARELASLRHTRPANVRISFCIKLRKG